MQEVQNDYRDSTTQTHMPHGGVSSQLPPRPLLVPPPAPPMLTLPIPQDYTSQLVGSLDGSPSARAMGEQAVLRSPDHPDTFIGQQQDGTVSQAKWSTNPIRARPWASAAVGGGRRAEWQAGNHYIPAANHYTPAASRAQPVNELTPASREARPIVTGRELVSNGMSRGSPAGHARPCLSGSQEAPLVVCRLLACRLQHSAALILARRRRRRG